MTTIAVTASTSAKLANSRLQVSTSETLGRGLAVIQDIPAGSLLFRTNPLISVLDDSLLDKACSTCFSVSKTVDGSVGKDLFKCTGCGLAHYCSKTCQRKDWKVHHSKECKYLQLNKNTPPVLLRGVMRLINLYAGDEKSLTFAEDVGNLLAHMDQLQTSERWEAVQQISEGINRITAASGGGRPLSSDGIKGIQQLSCKFMINSLTLVSAAFDQLGMTFDPSLALLNHSCNPNAAVVFDQNIACVRSIRDIKKGEQVTISYVDNTYKRSTRRSQLRSQYYFDCHCEGCEPKDNVFTGRDSWLCEDENCKALIPEPLLTGDFKCPKCHLNQTQSLDSLRNLETKAFTVLETVNTPQNLVLQLNNILLPTLAALTSNHSWPSIRQPAPALRRQIFHLCLNSENYEAAYHHSNTLSSPPLSTIHPETYHPLQTVQLFTTASLIALLASKENSVDYLKRAWELLRSAWELCKGSHGEGSEFAKRIAAKRGEVEMDLSLGGEEVRKWMRMHH